MRDPATLRWSLLCVFELCFYEDVLGLRRDGQELVSCAGGIASGVKVHQVDSSESQVVQFDSVDSVSKHSQSCVCLG